MSPTVASDTTTNQQGKSSHSSRRQATTHVTWRGFPGCCCDGCCNEGCPGAWAYMRYRLSCDGECFRFFVVPLAATRRECDEGMPPSSDHCAYPWLFLGKVKAREEVGTVGIEKPQVLAPFKRCELEQAAGLDQDVGAIVEAHRVPTCVTRFTISTNLHPRANARQSAPKSQELKND